MKILLVADTHACNPREMAKLNNLPNISFILTLGDIMPLHFSKLKELNIPILGVVGNHDSFNRVSYYGGTDLHGKLAMIMGIRLTGIRGSHKYKDVRYPSLTQGESVILASTLKKADILVTHTSPYGMHERNQDSHAGLLGIRQYILRHQPRYHIHGHQHLNQISMLGNTKVISILGLRILDYESGVVEDIP